jgi:hypothetical protein
VDDQFIKALVTYTLGYVSLQEAAYDVAETYFAQAIERFTHLNDKRMQVFGLNEMARTVDHQGKHDKAIRLLGYSQALASSFHLKLPAQASRRYQSLYNSLKARSDEEQFQRLWQQGEAMVHNKLITALL